MAGTDNTQELKTGHGGPAVVLVAPQMGENIGAAARAMLNCGLDTLRLVNPRDGWPSEQAEAMSSGALERMPPVTVYDSTAAAIADCHFVLATTARPRDMVKPVFTPRAAAIELRGRAHQGQKTALLFGGERAGLDNDDVALAHGIITIPLNPAFSSLNLGQAVLLTAYEWFTSGDGTPALHTPSGDSAPATHEELHGLFDRMETELQESHFFRTEEQKPTMVRNLRNLLSRARMTEQEIRTFHGMISALTGKKTPVK